MTDPRTPELDPRLRERIARLPEEIAPARDLWPDIRATLEAERVRPFPAAGGGGRARRLPPWVRLVAAGAVLVAGTATVTWRVMRDRTPGIAATEMRPDGDALTSYERSVEELTTALDRRAARLDPDTRAVLERSLRTIDDAIDEARSALARDPSSPAIRAFVEAAYRQKIDFLRRANDVASLREI